MAPAEGFDIERTIAAVRELGAKRVALQFPDELLGRSADVVAALRDKCDEMGAQVFVLADTTFGSYDVDEVAAQHVNADLIVHYGQASLLRTARLPTLFVFGEEPIDVDDCHAKFVELLLEDGSDRQQQQQQQQIVVLYDVVYAHAIEALRQRLHTSVVFSTVVREWNIKDKLPAGASISDIAESGRGIVLPEGTSIADCRMFYIGSESPTLTHLMMTYNRNQFFSYDPVGHVGRRETLNVSKALMRRYYLVQRAKEADVIGIIVATLGSAGYLAIVENLKKLIRANGKRVYTFVMGKLNVAKMANFMEVDVYCIVASPENSLIDSKDYPKPIVTPFELEVALSRSREWTGEFLIDFGHVLPGLTAAVTEEEERDEPDSDEEPEFSLITGSYKVSSKLAAVNLSEDSSSSAGTVAVRNQHSDVVLASGSGDYLSRRLFKGLEQRIGETPVQLAVEGRRGVARGYEHEGDKGSDSPLPDAT